MKEDKITEFYRGVCPLLMRDIPRFCNSGLLFWINAATTCNMHSYVYTIMDVRVLPKEHDQLVD
jgi:hypothetical protein